MVGVLADHKLLDKVGSDQVTRLEQTEKDSLQSLASDPAVLIMSAAIRALCCDKHIMRFLPPARDITRTELELNTTGTTSKPLYLYNSTTSG